MTKRNRHTNKYVVSAAMEYACAAWLAAVCVILGAVAFVPFL
jgi:hypothetical protein